MNYKNLVLICIFLMLVQTIVIAVITRSNKNFFDKHQGYAYARAIAELAQQKPFAALLIRVCYLAFVAELVVLIILKVR